MAGPKATRDDTEPRPPAHAGPDHSAPEPETPAPSAVDPRAGETASQDRGPTADDLQIEATLVQKSRVTPGIDEWREAQRRFEPGLPDDPDRSER